MLRKLAVMTSTIAVAVAAGSFEAQAATLHDFDQTTLASYLSLRFSSAVPPNVIRAVLAREGFSQTDLALVTSSPQTAPGSSQSSGGSGVFGAQQISHDTLACPASDPNCELDTQVE